MNTIFSAIDTFFFRRIDATGFGIMRIAWGITVFLWMLTMWQDVTFYYSNAGLVPPAFNHLFFRTEYRFTILNGITDPSGVWLLYLVLLSTALMTAAGILPRLSTIITVLLFFSFQERNLLPLGGGDTVLRTIGFILALCPELRAVSLVRLRMQWEQWRSTRTLLPPLTMSIWPYRLLLWQAMIIYVYSGIEKFSGTMWLDGTAVEVFFHHTNFFRWSKTVGDFLSPLSTCISYFTLIMEFAWLLLLLPKAVLERMPYISYGSLKRGIILCAALFHLGIFMMADVGVFPFAMFTLYWGLLTDDDWSAFRTWMNRTWKGTIAVLYDGKCGLCLRSIFILQLLDALHRLQPVNFYDTEKRKKIAPKLTLKTLDRAMHIVTPSKKIEKGFSAFRLLCWHLPLLWPMLPCLYLPGTKWIGDQVYASIATRRRRCSHENCAR